jgi:hypothetical protein
MPVKHLASAAKARQEPGLDQNNEAHVSSCDPSTVGLLDFDLAFSLLFDTLAVNHPSGARALSARSLCGAGRYLTRGLRQHVAGTLKRQRARRWIVRSFDKALAGITLAFHGLHRFSFAAAYVRVIYVYRRIRVSVGQPRRGQEEHIIACF